MEGWDRRVILEKMTITEKMMLRGRKDVIYEDKRRDNITSRGYSNTNIVRWK